MEGHPDSFSILVVCDGNVCRSPTAQFMLATSLPDTRVASAGMHAMAGVGFCEVATDTLIRHGHEVATFAREFRSRRIRDLEPAEFGLILTATKEHRADLARAHPDLRDRIFTLREAAGLLSGLIAMGEARGPADFVAVVALMNKYRGALASPTIAEPFRLGRTVVEPVDIPDAHQRRVRMHRAVIDLTAAAASDIADSLRTLAIG
jgi:protein-tyrosine phosphatase